MSARIRYRPFAGTACAFVLSLCAASAVPAQSSDPAWLDDLNHQLQADKQCEVSYIVRMRESQLGEKNVYEARVQCADGRMFDASRVGDSSVFTFTACDVQVC